MSECFVSVSFAGSSKLTVLVLYLSPDNVNHREHDHPHCVHEMPVERQHVKAIRVLLLRHIPRNVNAKTVESKIRPTIT